MKLKNAEDRENDNNSMIQTLEKQNKLLEEKIDGLNQEKISLL